MLRNSAVVTSENSSFRSPHPTIPPPLAGWSSSSHPKQNFTFHTCPMSSTLIPFLDRMFGVGFAYANGWDEENWLPKIVRKKTNYASIISTFGSHTGVFPKIGSTPKSPIFGNTHIFPYKSNHLRMGAKGNVLNDLCVSFR